MKIKLNNALINSVIALFMIFVFSFQASASPNPLGGLAGIGFVLLLLTTLLVSLLLLIIYFLVALFKDTIAVNTVRKINRLMWLLTGLGVIVLACYAWQFYPNDVESMNFMLLIWITIHLFVFVINQSLKYTNKLVQ